jgi:hypothetical protein
MSDTKQQKETDRRLDQLEDTGSKLSTEDVKHLAVAIALANSHSHPGDWAERVVRAWNTGSAQEAEEEG